MLDAMQTTLHIETTVLPGNRVEFSAPELPEGTKVEVIVMVPAPRRQSMLEYLKTLPPGPLVFKTPAEVDAYLQEERNAWDR
jgi:hypothetical protein